MTLDSLLEGFQANQSKAKADISSRRAITIWLLPEDCARFARLQEMSGRSFGKKARQALLMLMELAELKATNYP